MRTAKRASSHHQSAAAPPKRSRAAPTATAIDASPSMEFDAMSGEPVSTLTPTNTSIVQVMSVEPPTASNTSKKRKKARLAYGSSNLRISQSQLNGCLKFPTTYKPRYEKLETRPFVPCKALDLEFLRTCELEHVVRTYLSNVGWEEYLNVNRPAYYELVYEFFTTFEFNKIDGLNNETPNVIKFRLMNKWKKCTLSEFNVALGFATSELVTSPEFAEYKCDYVDYFENQTTLCWRKMTNDTSLRYNPQASTDSYLLDPVLRYLHRFLAFSFSGRALSPTICSKAEFYVLWCKVNNVKLNFAYWIATQFNSVVQNKSELRLKSLILGSLITNLAINLGCFDPEDHDLHEACDIELLDEATLRKWRMLKSDSPTPVFVAPGPPWRELVAKKKKGILDDSVGSSSPNEAVQSLTLRVDELSTRMDTQQAQLDRIEMMVQALLDKAP